MPEIRLKLLLAVLCALGTVPVYGQADDHDASEYESSVTHESDHGSHKNIFSFFTGITHTGRRENSGALGLGYERLLNESFGIGMFAEHTFGDAEFTVYAVSFAYRLDRWKFIVAPGIENSRKHGAESLVRLGTEYAFEAGSWEISPQLAVDFVDGDEVLVLGVVFGKSF